MQVDDKPTRRFSFRQFVPTPRSTLARPAVSQAGRILLILSFALAYKQLPLYSSNQNHRFLHGLASAQVGYLAHDWLAQTVDPFPLFDMLVTITVQTVNTPAFYLYHIALAGIYAFSLAEIGAYVFQFKRMGGRSLLLFLFLIALYSGLLARLLRPLPLGTHLANVVDAQWGLLTQGVAQQYILGPVFQPSAFGVLLVLSVLLHLRRRPVSAITCLVVAGAFHPQYLLAGGILAGIYLANLVAERQGRKALWIGLFALLAVLPFVIESYRHFSPAAGDISAQAQAILAEYRFPHHAIIAKWFGWETIAKTVLTLVAIYMARRTRLFPVLLVTLLVTIALTLIQATSGNLTLALLFPWRTSTFLVPIASSIVIAWFVAAGYYLYGHAAARGWVAPAMAVPFVQTAAVVVILLIGVTGASRTMALFDQPIVGMNPSTQFVADTYRPGDLYLIPVELQTFRLAAGVPILVDYKSHPYSAREVVAWFDRLQAANRFYAANNAKEACQILGHLAAQYDLTHVLLHSSSVLMGARCTILHAVYQDADFTVGAILPAETLFDAP